MRIRIQSRAGRLLRIGERGLCFAGALLLASWAGASIEGRLYQAYQNEQLNRALQAAVAAPDAPGGSHATQNGGILGRLEIPRLGLSVLVLNGDDATTLILGAGRLPGSATAGGAGNLVIAAHRDTFFRPLHGIRKDDRILVTTTNGAYPYVVQWTEVVNPSDTAVLAKTSAPSLTLVTCYPFEYIGSAPERFVVRARLAGAAQPVPAPAHDRRPSPFLAQDFGVR